MQELFAKLRTALEGEADFAEVQRLLAEIDVKYPNEAWRARAMVDGVIISQGGQPQTKAPPAAESSWLSPKTLWPLLGGLGVGGSAGAGLMSISWTDLKKPPLPDITNQWILLAIVGVVGALAGVGHAFYRNNFALNLPSFSWQGGQFKIGSFGFLRNMFVATLVSIATTWFGFANVSAETSEPTKEVRPPAPTPGTTLLTWNVLISAIVAGVVGSRMASGEVDMNNLWQALGKVAESPGVPGLNSLVKNAKTANDAVKIALRAVTSPTAELEKVLLGRFDLNVLRDTISKLGKPLDVKGERVTLASLKILQDYNARIQDLLKSVEIETAARSVDALAAEARNRGLNPDTHKEVLERLHAAAQDVMKSFRDLPPTWRLSAEDLPETTSNEE